MVEPVNCICNYHTENKSIKIFHGSCLTCLLLWWPDRYNFNSSVQRTLFQMSWFLSMFSLEKVCSCHVFLFMYFFLELKLAPSVLTEARGFCRSCKYILELVSQNLVGEHVIARKDKLDLFGPQKLPVLKPVSLTQSTRASTRKQKMKRGFIFQPHRESKDPCKSTESWVDEWSVSEMLHVTSRNDHCFFFVYKLSALLKVFL